MNILQASSTKKFHKVFLRWNALLAEAILCQDANRLIEKIVEIIYLAADIDSISIMIYSKSTKPTCLYDNIKPINYRGSITNYINGPYRDNPFYLLALSQPVSGLYSLRQVASEGFWESEHYKQFYKDTNMRDELDFLFPLDGNHTFVYSMGRDFQDDLFDMEDIETLKAIQPTIKLLTGNYIKLIREPTEVSLEKSDKFTSMQSEIDSEFGGVLTEREKEVVFLILNGCSVKESSRLLDISPGTIKAHKKSIYSKLGISTQGDLFSLFINELASKV